MGLKEYWTKRDFETTPEPKGKAPAPAKSKGLSFVIQKHAASHLHYDFRLELDGTLKSWAVPKGPSLNPKDKRLAVHVEDHPLEYGSFEGVIPPKQYGSGSVIIWDRGTWEPLGDAQESYAKGKLKFQLKGEKLQGGWTLARMGGRAADGPKENWLLIKENDQEAKIGDAADIVASHPLSVESGRDVAELAYGKDKEWNSKPKNNSRVKKRTVKSLAAPSAFIKPQLATLVDIAPGGDKWVHEIKYDGYRMLCRIEENGARMYSRNEKEWTAVFPTVVTEAGQLPLQNAWLDGEVVSVNAEGVSSFQALQNGLENGRMPENILYYVFDLLYLDGEDLTALPLLERKTRLAKLLADLTVENSHILYSDHMQIEGEIFFRYACQHGLEGIISKDAQAPYAVGRSRSWLKTKCLRRQEFVIAGYTEPAGSRSAFGALLLGIYDSGELTYSGKVGTGFNEKSLQAIYKRLSKIEQKNSPLINPPKGYGFQNVHWVKPELVAEIGFSEWTDAGSLRHPTFHGLREDKPAKDVVKEIPSLPPEEGNGLKKTSNKKDAIVAGIKLTHPERVLFAEASITKHQLAEFYERIGEWILPHLNNRPLTLVRCPDGGQGKCFYQKHANATVPKAIGRIEIQEAEGTVIYMNANDVSAIVGLVQMGVLEFHTWGSHSDKPECPDRVTFDLDPDPMLPWSRLTEAAMLMRGRLQSLGLESFVKTTGSKGLHVVMPLVRKHSWDEVKLFSKALSEEFAKADPKRFTSKMTKATRVGKIYIDYLRNGREATAVAAFSTRAKPHAPVSTPLEWAELEETPASDYFTVKTLPKRLEGLKQDPWKEYATIKQSITAAIKKELKI